MIISHCPWYGDRKKPNVLKNPDPVTGRRTITYKCKNCEFEWHIGSDGEPEKSE